MPDAAPDASGGAPRWTSAPAVLGLVALAVALSRVFLRQVLLFGPDPGVIPRSWQHLAPEHLRDDLLGALWGLNSQPPLWNGLLGLAAKACDAQASCMAGAVWTVSVALTVAMAMAIRCIVARLGGGPRTAALAALGFALTPAGMFYEAFPTYAHFTAALVAGFAVAALRFAGSGRGGAYAAALAALVALSWTWTLAHPALVLATGLALGPWTAARPRRAWAALALALAVAAAPAAKVWLRTGMPSSGTWLGFSLAQTVTPRPEGCRFTPLIEAHARPGEAPGETLNGAWVAPRSAACRDAALATILNDPLAWLGGRAAQALRTLSERPVDYPYGPQGWDRVPGPIRDLLAGRVEAQGARPARLALRGAFFALNLAAFAAMARGAAASRDPAARRFWRAAGLFCLLFLTVAHLANGAEQERMRHTLLPILWPAFALAAAAAAARFRRGAGASDAPRPGA